MIYSARHSHVVRRIWELDATDVRRALIEYLKADRNVPFPAESKYEDVDVEILDGERPPEDEDRRHVACRGRREDGAVKHFEGCAITTCWADAGGVEFHPGLVHGVYIRRGEERFFLHSEGGATRREITLDTGEMAGATDAA